MTQHAAVRPTPGGVTKLYLLRAERALRQGDLAELSGIHRSRISLIERGESRPSEREEVGLARALGLSIGELAELVHEARQQSGALDPEDARRDDHPEPTLQEATA